MVATLVYHLFRQALLLAVAVALRTEILLHGALEVLVVAVEVLTPPLPQSQEQQILVVVVVVVELQVALLGHQPLEDQGQSF
tara:strand:- start:125 stop:370 length:246 start_codon:yes stop_codon:yes gene_type:complete